MCRLADIRAYPAGVNDAAPTGSGPPRRERFESMTQHELITELPPLAGMGLVDIDLTLFVSSAIFLVLLIVLNKLLFQPYLKIVHDRQAMTVGAADAAEETMAKADSVLGEYQERIAAARTEAGGIRDGLRAEGRTEESRLVADARGKADAQLASHRDNLEREVAKAEQEIEARATALSSAIVERVLA